MIKIEILWFKTIKAEHLVLDFNGTLAIDVLFIEGVIGQLVHISVTLHVHVRTADTFSSVQNEIRGLPITIIIPETTEQNKQKSDSVKNSGSESIIAIGKGKNDVLMLKEAFLSIGIIQAEGAFFQVLSNSQFLCSSVIDALSLLNNPKRLVANLRN